MDISYKKFIEHRDLIYKDMKKSINEEEYKRIFDKVKKEFEILDEIKSLSKKYEKDFDNNKNRVYYFIINCCVEQLKENEKERVIHSENS